ncbi:MAG: FixH family protein [Wenzhouxiangellaceae bacterium]
MNTVAHSNRSSRLWLWLTLPPLAAIAGAVVTIYLALTNPDPVIRQHTEKVGKAHLADNSQAQAALSLQLQGRLRHDRDNGEISLILQGESSPPVLVLSWVHPTDSMRDQQLRVSRLGGANDSVNTFQYRGHLSTNLAERGYWILQDIDGAWALQGTANSAGEVMLQPVIR